MTRGFGRGTTFRRRSRRISERGWGGVEEEIDGKELTRLLNSWLETLPTEDRRVFVRRYWYGDSVKEMASRSGIRAGAMRQRLYRLRLELRALLTKEGYTL